MDSASQNCAPPVFIVEDDEFVAERLCILLAGEDIPVHTVTTLNEARERISAQHFPILILDRKLDDGDGIELCREYHRLANGKPSYIVVVSALGTLANIVEGVDAGVDTYLTKEGSADDTIESVRKGIRTVTQILV